MGIPLISKDLNNLSIKTIECIGNFLKIESLEKLCSEIVLSVPNFLIGSSCSIFLQPNLVKNYRGILINVKGNTFHRKELFKEIIVLAAHSNKKKFSPYIGKYFYYSGEGITGWVFKNKSSILLKNANNYEEVKKYKRLFHINKYSPKSKNKKLSISKQVRSVLAIPLQQNEKCYGVIKFVNSMPKQVFSRKAQVFADYLASLIINIIQKENQLLSRNSAIKNFSTVRSTTIIKEKNKTLNLFAQEISKIFNAFSCDLYVLGKNGNKVILKVSSDPFAQKNAKKYVIDIERGDGLVGWIFKTSKPIIINYTPHFYKRKSLPLNYLRVLCKYPKKSKMPFINEEDKALKLSEKDKFIHKKSSYRFMGVPILSEGGKIRGVLSVIREINLKKFSKSDIELLQDLASCIYSFFENTRRQELKNLLIRLGTMHSNELFDYVVNHIPNLVYANACSIFKKIDEPDHYQLIYTNCKDILKPKSIGAQEPVDVVYNPNMGKTGLAAKLKGTLVINHYGYGEYDNQKLKTDYGIYKKDISYNKKSLVSILTDINDRPLALARIIRDINDEPFKESEIYEFEKFASTTKYVKGVLPSGHPKKICERGEVRSFLAAPIEGEKDEVCGILRIPRSFPGGIFTDEDLDLVTAVTNRLSFAFLREEKEQLLEMEIIKSRQRSTLGLIASGFIHELRQPLQKMLTRSQICKKKIKRGLINTANLNKIENDFTLIIRQIKNVKQIIQELFDFARVRGTILEKVNIYSFFEDFLMIYRHRLISHDIKIETSYSEDLPHIKADKIQLAIVFANLLYNSIDALKNNERKQIKISAEMSGDDIVISFQDNGPGIPKNKSGNIFLPCETTTKKRTGLGLHISREILNTFGGNITLNGKNPEGAKFLITLPALY